MHAEDLIRDKTMRYEPSDYILKLIQEVQNNTCQMFVHPIKYTKPTGTETNKKVLKLVVLTYKQSPHQVEGKTE